ncbi:MAG: MFS transporter [Pseudorhodoplanes sp.]
MNRDRIVPLIVAVALFMENIDSSIIATSLPAIATDIGTDPIALKVAVTSYLLSLAVFIPASGWTADRLGARTVFRAAIALFVLGSLGCAFAGSLSQFVAARILQGMGGAMMTPVARLVLVRSVDKRALVGMMAWVTTPSMIGPLIGPPLGGFITTYFTWHWIFLINVPIGIIGAILVTRYIDPVRAPNLEPFDPVGFILCALAVAGLAFGFSTAGLMPFRFVVILVGVGAVASIGYYVHARRTAFPILDISLMRLPTFRTSVIGASLFRVGVGALPFLLPLLLQVGFGLSPLQSGLITFAGAIGSLGMKTVVTRIIGAFGYRRVLVVNAIINSAIMMGYGIFTQQTPTALIITLLILGGFFRSLQFTTVNTLAYDEVEPQRVSRATTLAAVAQQMSLSMGVAVGAFVVETSVWWRGENAIAAGDFNIAFVVVGLISGLSFFSFLRLHPDAGSEMSGRRISKPPENKE